jgi:hypothetical protein
MEPLANGTWMNLPTLLGVRRYVFVVYLYLHCITFAHLQSTAFLTANVPVSLAFHQSLQGGCDSNDICGMRECPAVEVSVTDAPTEVVTMDPDATLNGTNLTCAMLQGGCQECLGYGCFWVGDMCDDTCDVTTESDMACTTGPAMDMSMAETCNAADDVALCTNKNYCFTCTSTVMSDGVTTCSWYVDGDREWCDVGGCTEAGICGDSSEESCQVDSGPGLTPALPNGGETDPPPSSSANSSRTRSATMAVGAAVMGWALVVETFF